MFGKWVMRLAAILVVAMAAPLARAIPEPRATILRQEDGQTGYKDLSENQSVAGKKLSDALPGQYMDLKVVYYPIDNNVTVKAYR